MARYLPFLISLGLTIYALFSCIQSSDEEVPYLPKLVWVILIVLVPFAGPIVWLIMARAQRQRLAASGAGPARGGGPSRPAGPPGPPRRSAPDDDPEFLAWLDRQQRRNQPPKPDMGPSKPAAGPSNPPKTGAGPSKSSKPSDGKGGKGGKGGKEGQNGKQGRGADQSGASSDGTAKGEQNEDEARPHDD